MNSELYYKLARLQWLLHKQLLRVYADNGPMADTTRGKGRILALLKLRDGISTKDLSYLLGVRVSSLNELLSKLEKSGHVTREPSEQDKRIMLVKLTEKGKGMEEPNIVGSEALFDCLSENERQAFSGYLDRIITSLMDKLSYDDKKEFERMIAVREHFMEMIGEHFDRTGFHGMHGGIGQFVHRNNKHSHDFKGFDRCGRGTCHEND